MEPLNALPIVVIGSGLAGYGLAREMHRESPGKKLVVITRDGGEAYSKPTLSNAFAHHKTPDQLPTSTAAEVAAHLNIEVRTETAVQSIDRELKVVHTDKGDVAYSQLVLALGADPIRLPLGGDAAEAVLSVNDLRDYTRFREQLPERGRVVILGAGLIGCEFANDLLAAGHKVTVIDLAERPLGRIFPPEFGEALRDEFAEEGGVEWRLADSVQSVDKQADGSYAVTLQKSGERLEADVVLSAIGLRPRVALAQAAGLQAGRGIAVDAQLNTNDPHIFAIGDCAEVEGSLQPYIMPIMSQVRALAKTLTGQPTDVDYPVMPVVVKTPLCPLVIALPATAEALTGKWEVAGQSPDLEASYKDEDGRLIGFALSGAIAQQRQDWVKRVEAEAGQVLETAA